MKRENNQGWFQLTNLPVFSRWVVCDIAPVKYKYCLCHILVTRHGIELKGYSFSIFRLALTSS